MTPIRDAKISGTSRGKHGLSASRNGFHPKVGGVVVTEMNTSTPSKDCGLNAGIMPLLWYVALILSVGENLIKKEMM